MRMAAGLTSHTSTTPAPSPGPTSTCSPVCGRRFRWMRDDLYEQCSDHITSNMATSSRLGSRPRMRRMSSSSPSVRATRSPYRAFFVHLADQVDEMRQRVEVALLRQSGAQRRHPAVAVQPQARLDHLRRAEQVRLLPDLDRHARRRLLALAVEPELLHGAHVVLVALAGERVDVEVLLARAHGAEREGVAAGVTLEDRLVVGDLDADGDGHVEVVEAARLAHRTEEHLGVLGHERV